VIAMFASILVWLALPWLDTSKVRSGNFRPMFKWFFAFLVVDMLILMWLGAQKPEGNIPLYGKFATLYYFAYFFVILPVLSRKEKTLPLPESISSAVLKPAK